MQSVCYQCHSENFIKQFYTQFDSLVELYNKKFAVPATNMRKALMEAGKLTKNNYDETLDRIYWKLVDNEGRRAKFGTAMAGPVYAWRKGMQEVAERYYMEFIPEVKKIVGWKADNFLRKHGYIEPGSQKRHK